MAHVKKKKLQVIPQLPTSPSKKKKIPEKVFANVMF
jgi:hypothetical protein